MREIYYIWRREYHRVFHNIEVPIFFFLLVIAYPVLYALVYNPETVRDVPVAVVDDDRSQVSRELVRRFDASPEAQVIAYCANIEEARRLMMETACYGILHIPHDFDATLVRGNQATVVFYADMSLLINYKGFLMALTDVTMDMGSELRTASLPIGISQSLMAIAGNPIPYSSITMYNPEGGFASFLIPAVLVLVLQQSLILGLGTLAGGIQEDKKKLAYKEDSLFNPLHLLIGKALCYTSLYIFNIVYLFHFIPWLFHYPQMGNQWEIYTFSLPLTLSSIFFGMTLSAWVKEQENSFLLFVFTSVIFIFLSGIAWPRYAMPIAWQWLGVLIPSTWGVEGFVQMNTAGASLSQVAKPYTILWLLAALYAVTAYAVIKNRNRKSKETFSN